MELFPFADAPEIIRANQKDALVEIQLRQDARELVQWARGIRFLHAWSAELDAACSAVYLALTTLVGARTLGEEYTDLIYLTRDRQLPSRSRIALFVLGSSLGPLLLQRWVSVARARIERSTEGSKWEFLSSWATPTTLASVNLAIFYFSGAYYQLSKRFLGLRYALGHARDPLTPRTGSYELLGVLMLVRGLAKVVTQMRLNGADETPEEKVTAAEVTLESPDVLPFVPAESRSCNLCLETMRSPALTLCGHMFCWSCITEWCRERAECPLCRQACTEQQILLLAAHAKQD